VDLRRASIDFGDTAPKSGAFARNLRDHMDSETTPASNNLVELTADVVSAYVSNNPVGSAALSDLISSVHGALSGLLTPPAPPVAERPAPAVPVKKSVTPDYLISLEDGRRYKSLKRHLSGRGLTPDQYRAKWGLPHDYPMVAANYAKQRSDLARSMGLGRKRAEAEPAEAAKPGRRRKSAA
jgi:predicted transcriptional regulator